jgi:hypothetical protein
MKIHKLDSVLKESMRMHPLGVGISDTSLRFVTMIAVLLYNKDAARIQIKMMMLEFSAIGFHCRFNRDMNTPSRVYQTIDTVFKAHMFKRWLSNLSKQSNFVDKNLHLLQGVILPLRSRFVERKKYRPPPALSLSQHTRLSNRNHPVACGITNTCENISMTLRQQARLYLLAGGGTTSFPWARKSNAFSLDIVRCDYYLSCDTALRKTESLCDQTGATTCQQQTFSTKWLLRCN